MWRLLFLPFLLSAMALGVPSSALHLKNATATATAANPRAPSAVTIHPSALFGILDHYLRRTDAQPRVIGTLLGTRSADGSGAIDVTAAFAVLHSETTEQVAVDSGYHRNMLELAQRVNPREHIVGWYSTGGSLDTYSSLIQNFYTQETAPSAAVHVVLDAGATEGAPPAVKAYISSPVGTDPKPENCVFVPIPCSLRFSSAERAGLDLLAATALAGAPTQQPTTDLDQLAHALAQVQDMLARVLAWVRRVRAGDARADAALGRYLLDALGAAPETDDSAGFHTSLQDTLMVSYLANLVQAQAEITSRLALVS